MDPDFTPSQYVLSHQGERVFLTVGMCSAISVISAMIVTNATCPIWPTMNDETRKCGFFAKAISAIYMNCYPIRSGRCL